MPRSPLDWQNPAFYNQDALCKELERVYDICHTCRRCVNLCHAFPTLFDLVDASPTLEVDGVAKQDYWQVVEHCYLCDLCYLSKCPYVPPHEWNLDFPHLMLRAKAVKYRQGQVKWHERMLADTDTVGKLADIPVVAEVVNTLNRFKPARRLLATVLGVHPDATLPVYHANTLRRRLRKHRDAATAAGATTGKVALFSTCYVNRNEPDLGEDLLAVFAHNGIPVRLVEKERCCGMPKLALGDLDGVAAAKEANIPWLAELAENGYDLTALVPSCVLMFKQTLPLLFPDDPAVRKVKDAFYDPFEYLMRRHKAGKLNTDFKQGLGKVAYHAACHQRVQNMGRKTKDILALIPDTEVRLIERCAGHNGTYGVKTASHPIAMKIVRPLLKPIQAADHYGSDCAMAGHHIANALNDGSVAEHPIRLLRRAYGI